MKKFRILDFNVDFNKIIDQLYLYTKKHFVLIINMIILFSLFVSSIKVNHSVLNNDQQLNYNDSNEIKEEIKEEEVVKEEIKLSEDTSNAYKIAIAKSDKTYEIVSSEKNYEDAVYKVNHINLDDFIIIYNEQIIYVKYGLVNLDTKPISENTYFYVNGVRNYINGSFADDALFIDNEDDHFKLMISNTIGLVNKKDVELIPLAYIKNPSYYFVNSFGQLVHAISHNLFTADSYDYSGPIDYAPDYFVKGVKYFSYDGVYFYRDIKTLINDKRSNHNENAINANNPHYSYYLYLPMRSLSTYTATELNSFLSFELTRRGVKSTSILNGTGQYFINVQNTYKLNAAMELVWALHESDFGTSSLAKTKYNLFGMNAIDSNPYGNADRFNSLQSGINYHADYFIARQYLNHENILYNGTSFGNKGTGFNVAYASDPYWGEKIAGFYFQLDDYLGGKDYQKYDLGVTGKASEIYLQPNQSSGILYIETANKDEGKIGLPLIIVGEEDEFYKVKLNASIVNNEINYMNVLNYNTNVVGYVLKNNIVVI